jgi:hypothetical protein
VRSYLGLVPREYSSGERQRRGRINKAGSARARTLLVEAAWSLLRWKTERTKALHEWWARIAQRRGRRRPWWRWRANWRASCSRSGVTAHSSTRYCCDPVTGRRGHSCHYEYRKTDFGEFGTRAGERGKWLDPLSADEGMAPPPRIQTCAGRQDERPTKSADRGVKGTRCTESVCPSSADLCGTKRLTPTAASQRAGSVPLNYAQRRPRILPTPDISSLIGSQLLNIY